MVYFPVDQVTGFLAMLPTFEFSIRTAGDPTTTMRAMRGAMHDVAPDVPIEVLSPLSSLASAERSQPLFQARLLTTFSILALLLAAVGTYSTLAYSVAQRRHELAIRLALGAKSANVLRLILRRGAMVALAGVCIGLVGSFALSRALQSMLYQTSATDPRVFAGAAALLLVIAILACIVPTRRATHIDPITALREI
jgi:putative ABC transport system permease protein